MRCAKLSHGRAAERGTGVGARAGGGGGGGGDGGQSSLLLLRMQVAGGPTVIETTAVPAVPAERKHTDQTSIAATFRRKKWTTGCWPGERLLPCLRPQLGIESRPQLNFATEQPRMGGGGRGFARWSPRASTVLL